MDRPGAAAGPHDRPADGQGVWWSHLLHRRLQFLLDFLVLSCALALAYLLRFDFAVPDVHVEAFLVQLPLVVLLQFVALAWSGVYTFLWRYVGLAEVRSFAAAAWWSFLPLLLLRLGLPDAFQAWRVPLSILVLDTIFGFVGVLGLRVIRRIIYERYEKNGRQAGGQRKPVLLVGAGRAGVMAAKEIQSRGDMGLDVRGFIDDAEEKKGSVIQGVKVLGTTAELASIVRTHDIDHVILTIAQAERTDLRRIIEICDAIPIKTRIIPGLYEILGGDVSITRIRDVEIEDLLGRAPVQLEHDALTGLVADRVVMVTGAGGSIGSELVRQTLRFKPRKVLLVERSEGALFEIDRELRAGELGDLVEPLIADVTDEVRMRAIFEAHRPAVVLHAAAHKHVPMMEKNPLEAIKNNAGGTHLVGSLAAAFRCDAFVLISTDKAVRPTSVMGATKRVAELVVQALDQQHPDTRFVAVRFGNVLGSAGSVIPIFREQILAGGPVTVTHPDMVRYFMTIPEAAQLVLQAASMGAGGEIFILDMGEPVKILDLAKDMITLSGLKPFEDIDITFSGVRPGEKLFEELETDGENISKTRHAKIFIGQIRAPSPGEVDAALERFRELAARNDERAFRRLIGELLPESQIKGGRGSDQEESGGKVLPHPALLERA